VYASKQNDVKETIIRESTKLFPANRFRGRTSMNRDKKAAGIERAEKQQGPAKACPSFSW